MNFTFNGKLKLVYAYVSAHAVHGVTIDIIDTKCNFDRHKM